MYFCLYLGWFEMKPYSIHNRLVEVSARFATDKEIDLQPRLEERLAIYQQCSQIYNNQEQKLRDEAATR